MQTFLPVAGFAESATVLDRQRLGKQRVEVFNILEALAGLRPAWQHHPAVVMWRGAEFVLGEYGRVMCREWRSRGYEDNMEARIDNFLVEAMRVGKFVPGRNDHEVWWLGHEPFHRSHRSQLLRKAPEHYRQYWPNEPDDLDYVWPEGWPLDQMEQV